MATPSPQQLAQAERLKQLLLDRYESLLEGGELSATDAANLQRLLENGGWVLDADRVPQSLKAKLENAGLSLGDPASDDAFVDA